MLLTAFSLLIRVDGYWLVSPEVGKKIDLLTGLRAKVGKADPLLPPVQGWEYRAIASKWNSDPTMECSREVSPASLDSIAKKKLASWWLLLFLAVFVLGGICSWWFCNNEKENKS